ncbi:MAG: OsmC family protein [Desulfovibrio sp.]|nr:OsmC family protein [Desulfovibrio sp.]MBI4960640.1 OsmC family protein [Desulfovibrio sp.]
MSETITLTFDRSSDSNWKIHTGSAAMPVIDYNSSNLTQEEKANEHMGGRLMVAGAIACYTNSLWNDIKRAAGKPVSMSASATVTKEKTDSMRTAFTHIELSVELSANELDDAAFERIRDALYRGSLVTYSMEEGVEFDYDINLVK